MYTCSIFNQTVLPLDMSSTFLPQIFIGEISMYFIKSTRESLIAEEKMILTGDCCYLSPLLRRIVRFIGKFYKELCSQG